MNLVHLFLLSLSSSNNNSNNSNSNNNSLPRGNDQLDPSAWLWISISNSIRVSPRINFVASFQKQSRKWIKEEKEKNETFFSNWSLIFLFRLIKRRKRKDESWNFAEREIIQGFVWCAETVKENIDSVGDLLQGGGGVERGWKNGRGRGGSGSSWKTGGRENVFVLLCVCVCVACFTVIECVCVFKRQRQRWGPLLRIEMGVGACTLSRLVYVWWALAQVCSSVRECVCEASLPKFLSCTTRSVFQEVHATCTDVPNGDIKKKKYALQIF